MTRNRRSLRPAAAVATCFVFVGGFAGGTVSGAGVSSLPEPASSAEDSMPNVLVILTDDQRDYNLRVLPQVRKIFRKRGTFFRNAFVTTPLCCPSRATFFTGRYAHNHGVETNDDPSRLDQRSTIQRYLQDAGYRTALLGKYFNLWRHDPRHFDDWVMFRISGGFNEATYNINGRVRHVRKYSTDFIRNRSIRLLRQYESDDERPWFLQVHPYAPHAPFIPAKRHADARVGNWKGNPATFERDLSDKPEWISRRRKPFREGKRIRRDQLRTLMAVDDLVKEIFRELRRLGEADNTIAVFASDHGLHWGEHGLTQKHSPYLPAIEIPIFLKWPGRVPRGKVDDRFASAADVVPTIMDAAGLTPDPEYPLDGRSLLEDWDRDRVLVEFRKRQVRRPPTFASLVTRQYQYVEYYDDETDEVIFREYYDLVNDPWQLDNLLADGDPENDPPPETIATLHARLAVDRVCAGITGPTACP